jgi:hypothetical protein
LGNATANTTAAGHNGALWLYGTGTTYIDFRSNAGANKVVTIKTTGSTSREYTLPDKAGTFAMTADILGGVITDSKLDSETSWYVVFANGFILQGGKTKFTINQATTAQLTITFPKSYSTFIPTVVTAYERNSAGDGFIYDLVNSNTSGNVSKTGCKFRGDAFNTGVGFGNPSAIHWVAFGK